MLDRQLNLQPTLGKTSSKGLTKSHRMRCIPCQRDPPTKIIPRLRWPVRHARVPAPVAEGLERRDGFLERVRQVLNT